MRILIVDDSRSSLAYLGQVIGALGIAEVECLLSPRAALLRAAATQYDLVLVDHVMPEMDGVELTRLLRESEPYRLVPIVMVTSDNGRKLRVNAIAAGATDFVTKPFDPTELQARVRNLLALRRAQIELADQTAWLKREVESATRHLAERGPRAVCHRCRTHAARPRWRCFRASAAATPWIRSAASTMPSPASGTQSPNRLKPSPAASTTCCSRARSGEVADVSGSISRQHKDLGRHSDSIGMDIALGSGGGFRSA